MLKFCEDLIFTSDIILQGFDFCEGLVFARIEYRKSILIRNFFDASFCCFLYYFLNKFRHFVRIQFYGPTDINTQFSSLRRGFFRNDV